MLRMILTVKKIVAREIGWTWLLEALEAEERGEVPETDENEFPIEDEDEGEEWKKSTGYASEQDDDFHNVPVYQIAYQFALRAMRLVETLPEEYHSEECLRSFIESATIPAAKIAGSFGFGFEKEGLGGNIANCKRGLAMANRCLSVLQQLKEKGIVDEKSYVDLLNEAKEMRDALAVYITDLRERFQRGIP